MTVSERTEEIERHLTTLESIRKRQEQIFRESEIDEESDINPLIQMEEKFPEKYEEWVSLEKKTNPLLDRVQVLMEIARAEKLKVKL